MRILRQRVEDLASGLDRVGPTGAEFLFLQTNLGTARFQGPLRGISGHRKWVEEGENDAKWWDDTQSEGII